MKKLLLASCVLVLLGVADRASAQVVRLPPPPPPPWVPAFPLPFPRPDRDREPIRIEPIDLTPLLPICPTVPPIVLPAPERVVPVPRPRD